MESFFKSGSHFSSTFKKSKQRANHGSRLWTALRKVLAYNAHMFILFSLLSCTLFAKSMQFPWVVYYNDQEKPEAFSAYNPIVFDSDIHPLIQPLLAQHKEVLGYVNLGEVEEERSWFNQVKQAGILIRENPDWKGSWIVDIRQPAWKKILLAEVIPSILAQGFTGLFYDQLDVSIALEQEDPLKYKGMSSAAIDLVRSIRQRFPGKRVMMNRAYEILLRVGDAIDYALAESLYTSYNFEKKKYYIRTQEDYDWQLNYLNSARQAFPHLVIFSLDYWLPKEINMYKKIYSVERSHCLRPYVSTLLLDQIILEPKE